MRTIFVGLLLASSGCLWAADKANSLNVKPGLWETTMTTTTSGEAPIPPELLSKLTPEQRARMEEKMKAHSGEKTRTVTHKSCATKEQIDKGLAFLHDQEKNDQEKCTNTVVSSTSSTVEVRRECVRNGVNSSLTMRFEALSPESIKGSVQMNFNGGGHAMSGHTSFTSKWIGPVCSKSDE